MFPEDHLMISPTHKTDIIYANLYLQAYILSEIFKGNVVLLYVDDDKSNNNYKSDPRYRNGGPSMMNNDISPPSSTQSHTQHTDN